MTVQEDMKFCKFCGERIPFDAVVCTHCGRQVEMLQQAPNSNVVINNAPSASSSSASSSTGGRVRRHYSLLLDIVLTCLTGGLWLIWVLLRPKYDYVG